MQKKPEQQIAMQLLIGNLLRVGVTVSALLVLGGGLLYLMHYGAQQPILKTFAGEPDHLTHIPLIFKHALQGNSQSLIQAGLLVLILTPIARVILSVLVFALERDWLYVGITLLVLLLMVYSLLGEKV